VSSVGNASARALGRSGLRVGSYGFGVAPLANLGHEVADDVAVDALEAAWSAGVRYFDAAPHYGLGLGERRLGAFLSTKPRDEFILSTKVGRLLVENPLGARADDEGFDVRSPLMRRRDYSGDGIRRSLDESLDRLGLDRIDIVFVHDPDDFYREALDESFPALDELRRQGTIASYGAGMNQSAMLAEFVLNTDLDVVMCAGRYTLLEQGPLDDLLPAASARDAGARRDPRSCERDRGCLRDPRRLAAGGRPAVHARASGRRDRLHGSAIGGAGAAQRRPLRRSDPRRPLE
jgi:D-threo-aldose 1-dehydrogenase